MVVRLIDPIFQPRHRKRILQRRAVPQQRHGWLGVRPWLVYGYELGCCWVLVDLSDRKGVGMDMRGKRGRLWEEKSRDAEDAEDGGDGVENFLYYAPLRGWNG